MCNARLRALFVSAIAAGLLVFSAQTAAAASSLIYVTNSGGDNIHVVNPQTHKVVSTINGIEAAHGVAFSPDGTRVYASNEADHTSTSSTRRPAS
jgi:YVTN family beta-propeller protein